MDDDSTINVLINVKGGGHFVWASLQDLLEPNLPGVAQLELRSILPTPIKAQTKNIPVTNSSWWAPAQSSYTHALVERTRNGKCRTDCSDAGFQLELGGPEKAVKSVARHFGLNDPGNNSSNNPQWRRILSDGEVAFEIKAIGATLASHVRGEYSWDAVTEVALEYPRLVVVKGCSSGLCSQLDGTYVASSKGPVNKAALLLDPRGSRFFFRRKDGRWAITDDEVNFASTSRNRSGALLVASYPTPLPTDPNLTFESHGVGSDLQGGTNPCFTLQIVPGRLPLGVTKPDSFPLGVATDMLSSKQAVAERKRRQSSTACSKNSSEGGKKCGEEVRAAYAFLGSSWLEVIHEAYLVECQSEEVWRGGGGGAGIQSLVNIDEEPLLKSNAQRKLGKSWTEKAEKKYNGIGAEDKMSDSWGYFSESKSSGESENQHGESKESRSIAAAAADFQPQKLESLPHSPHEGLSWQFERRRECQRSLFAQSWPHAQDMEGIEKQRAERRSLSSRRNPKPHLQPMAHSSSSRSSQEHYPKEGTSHSEKELPLLSLLGLAKLWRRLRELLLLVPPPSSEYPSSAENEDDAGSVHHDEFAGIDGLDTDAAEAALPFSRPPLIPLPCLVELLWLDAGLKFELLPEASFIAAAAAAAAAAAVEPKKPNTQSPHSLARSTSSTATTPDADLLLLRPRWMTTPGRKLVETETEMRNAKVRPRNEDGEVPSVLARWVLLVSKLQAAMAPRIPLAAALSFVMRSFLTTKFPSDRDGGDDDDDDHAGDSFRREWRLMCYSVANSDEEKSEFVCWGIDDTASITDSTLRALKGSWNEPETDPHLPSLIPPLPYQTAAAATSAAPLVEDLVSERHVPSIPAIDPDVIEPLCKSKRSEGEVTTHLTTVEATQLSAEDDKESAQSETNTVTTTFQALAGHVAPMSHEALPRDHNSRCNTPTMMVRVRTRKAMLRIKLPLCCQDQQQGQSPTVRDLQAVIAQRLQLSPACSSSNIALSLGPNGAQPIELSSLSLEHDSSNNDNDDDEYGGSISLSSLGIVHGSIIYLTNMERADD